MVPADARGRQAGRPRRRRQPPGAGRQPRRPRLGPGQRRAGRGRRAVAPLQHRSQGDDGSPDHATAPILPLLLAVLRRRPRRRRIARGRPRVARSRSATRRRSPTSSTPSASGCHSATLAENKLNLEDVAGDAQGGQARPGARARARPTRACCSRWPRHRVEPVMPPKDKKEPEAADARGTRPPEALDRRRREGRLGRECEAAPGRSCWARCPPASSRSSPST